MVDDPTTPPHKRSRLRSWRSWLLALLVLFAVAQLVPYGRSHDNPKVETTPDWTSASIEQLSMDACGDCHSNETSWPWYSNIAPGSWLIQHDVDEGRASLNWSTGCAEAEEIREVMDEGEMPPPQYQLLHPKARLTDSEKRRLAQGLAESISRSSGFHECEGGEG
jgi:mono/diheme cytochrome c family protein